MEQYRAGKNEIITLSPEFIQELADAGQDWIRKTAEEQKAKGNSLMAEILADYNDYHARWKAESSYLIRD